MPKVDGKQYPYTKEGYSDAAKAKKKKGKGDSRKAALVILINAADKKKS